MRIKVQNEEEEIDIAASGVEWWLGQDSASGELLWTIGCTQKRYAPLIKLYEIWNDEGAVFYLLTAEGEVEEWVEVGEDEYEKEVLLAEGAIALFTDLCLAREFQLEVSSCTDLSELMWRTLRFVVGDASFDEWVYALDENDLDWVF